jgi:hypothetical protein
VRRAALAGLALLALAACRRERAAAMAGGGTFDVRWSTADSVVGDGRWSGPAEAGWCDSTGALAVLAARGDTGAALLVRSPDGAPGTFPLVPAPDSAQPRHAIAAVRFVSSNRVVAVTPFEGSLTLDGARPVAAGRFRGTAHLPGGEDSLVVEGTLAGIPVATGAEGCRIAGAGVP